MTRSEAVILSPVVQHTFLDDVTTVAQSIENTLLGLRLHRSVFPDLETVLRDQIQPSAFQHNLLDYDEFVGLCGEYLRAVPLDVSLDITSAERGASRTATQALEDQDMKRTLRSRLLMDEHYRDTGRSAIDAEVLEAERALVQWGHAKVSNVVHNLGVVQIPALNGFIAQYSAALRMSLYAQLGIRNHEDVELMEQLSFRALAQKRGWIARQGNNYVLAKSGKDLLSEFFEVGITAEIFEKYTGTKIVVTPFRLPVISGGTPAGSVSDFAGRIIILMDKTSTWAQGYHALRARELERDSPHPRYEMKTPTGPVTFYRPLTFGENLRARLVDARAHSNNLTQASSWNRWNDSCTAIIYGLNDKFKVQKISRDLLNLAPDFRQPFFQGQYNTVGTDNINIMEFNRGDAKYNEPLSKAEVLSHPFWQFIADGDDSLLQEYTQLLWTGKPAGYKWMAVWLSDAPQVGETRALFVGNRDNNSSAYGDYSLNSGGSFLRVL